MLQGTRLQYPRYHLHSAISLLPAGPVGKVSLKNNRAGVIADLTHASPKTLELLDSLWQVSAVTTADVMVGFYEKMFAGARKPEALREAKREAIRRNPECAKPYYWAPFILIGK